MPVRLLSSSVLKWPDKETVISALKSWAKEIKKNKNILKVGYFGSYSTGNWGVGSDLDIIIVLKECDLPKIKRPLLFDTTQLPVPVDLLVFTEKELKKINSLAFSKVLKKEVKWI